MRKFLFVVAILVAIPAFAAGQPTEQQCDRLVAEAFRMMKQDRDAGFNLLRSKAVDGCFRRFPDLNDKFFPIKMESSRNLKGPPINKDPAYSIKMR